MTTTEIPPPSPPVPPPSPPTLSLWVASGGDPARGRDLAAALVAGIAFDGFVRSGVASVGSALAACLGGAALVATGRVANRSARLALLAVPVFAIWLGLRVSPWVVLPTLIAIAGLLALAALWATGGSLADISPRRAVLAAYQSLIGTIEAPGFLLGALGRLTRNRNERSRAILRGVLLAAPVIAVLGALLASGDAVFASLFSVDTDLTAAFEHALLIGIGFSGLGVLAAIAVRTPPSEDLLPSTPRLGAIEVTVVLGGLVTLFAAFAATQLAGFIGGSRFVERTANLTYAEHARSGFFQLIAVAVLTLGVLGVMRILTDPDDIGAARRLMLLSEAAIALTLVIVAVAIRRLALYDQAYGLTMLRLYSTVAAVWIGAVFVLLGLRIAGVGRDRAWLLPAVGSLGLAFVLALNTLNPEATVVRHNLERGDVAAGLDVAYLGGLSADAVPVLADALATPGALDADDAELARRLLCDDAARRAEGWAATNLSAARAASRRTQVCTSP